MSEEELEILISHYGHEQIHKWIEDGEDCQIRSCVIIYAVQSQLEWDLLKKIVKAEHNPRDSMWKLRALVMKSPKKTSYLSILAQLVTILAVHITGSEPYAPSPGQFVIEKSRAVS